MTDILDKNDDEGDDIYDITRTRSRGFRGNMKA
jgi:hypothetical protein